MTARLAGALALGAIVWSAGSTASDAACARISPTKPGEVYLMRGLANIFSLGLDVYGKHLSEIGVENCVFNHSVWQSLVADVIERNYKGTLSPPIMIVGHSLGANIAPKMATEIAKHGIPVAYVAMLDPVEPTVVGGNVGFIINYYLPHRKDNRLYPGSDFTGQLENVNVAQFGGFDHFNIDEKSGLRSTILQRLVAATQEALDEKEGE